MLHCVKMVKEQLKDRTGPRTGATPYANWSKTALDKELARHPPRNGRQRNLETSLKRSDMFLRHLWDVSLSMIFNAWCAKPFSVFLKPFFEKQHYAYQSCRCTCKLFPFSSAPFAILGFSSGFQTKYRLDKDTQSLRPDPGGAAGPASFSRKMTGPHSGWFLSTWGSTVHQFSWCAPRCTVAFRGARYLLRDVIPPWQKYIGP